MRAPATGGAPLPGPQRSRTRPPTHARAGWVTDASWPVRACRIHENGIKAYLQMNQNNHTHFSNIDISSVRTASAVSTQGYGLPSQVLSPVDGPLGVVSALGDCSNTLRCFKTDQF